MVIVLHGKGVALLEILRHLVGVYGARVFMAECCSVRQDRHSTGSDPAARARPRRLTMRIVQMTFAERTDALSWLTRPGG